MNFGKAVKENLGILKQLSDQLTELSKKKDIEFNIKTNAEEALNELKELENSTGARIDSALPYYQKKDNAKARLVSNWNSLVDNNTNIETAIDVTSDESKEVYRLATAFEALGGNLSDINPEIQMFVEGMRNVSGLYGKVGITFDPSKLTEVFDAFDRIREVQDVEFPDFISDNLQVDAVKFFEQISEGVKNFADTTQQTSQQTQKSYDDMANTAEKSAERQKKALASIEDMRSRAASRKQDNTIDSDYSFRDKLGWRSDKSYIEQVDLSGDTDLEKYTNAVKELQEQQKNALTEAQRIYNDYINQINAGESVTLDESALNHQLDIYNDYCDGMEYAQNKLIEAREKYTEELSDFTSSGKWDEDTINGLIKALKNLAIEIHEIARAFGTIDDESGMPTLLSQIKDISGKIPEAFDPQSIDDFKQSLNNIENKISEAFNADKLKRFIDSLNEIKTAIDNIEPSTTSFSPTIGGAAQSTDSREWAKEYEHYINLYNKITKQVEQVSKGQYSQNDIFGAIINSSRNLGQQFNFDEDQIRDLYGLKTIQDSVDGTIEGYKAAIQRVMDYVKLLKTAMQESQGAIDLFKGIPKVLTNNNNTLNMSTLEKQVGKRVKADTDKAAEEANEQVKGLFGTDLTGVQKSLDQVVNLLSQLQDVLKQGFGIKDEEGTLSFFDRLAQKFKEISESTNNLRDSFATLVGLIGADSNKTELVGIDPENVKTITQAFIQLRDVIKEINSIRKETGIDIKKVADQTAQAVSNAKTSGSSKKPKAQVKKTETKTTQNKTTGQTKTQTTETISGEINVLDELSGYMQKAMAQTGNMREQAAKLANDAIDGYKSKLEEGTEQVKSAGINIAKAQLEGIQEGQDSNSPAKEDIKLGEDAYEGYAIGLEKGADRVKSAASELASAQIEQLKKEQKQQEETLNSMLDIKWQKDNGRSARFSINLEKMISESTITEIRKVLDLVDKSFNPDELINTVNTYVQSRLSDLSDQTTPKINKLYKLNQELNKRYDTPLIEDTREKVSTPKVDKLAQYRLPDETIENQNKLQTEMQETETQVDKVSTALEKLANMFREAGEEEVALTMALEKLKKTEIVDLAKDAGLYTPGSSKKSKMLLAADVSQSYINSIKAKDESSAQTKENIAIENTETTTTETNTNVIDENTEAIGRKTIALQKLAEAQKKANEAQTSLEVELGVNYSKKDIEQLYKDSGFDRTGLSKANKTQLTHALAEQYTNYENSLNKPSLNEIDSQLDNLETKSKELIATMSQIYAEPVSKNGNEDYYKSLYEDLEKINQEISEMRKNLSSLDIPDSATALTGKRDNILRQTSVVEGMVAGRKGQITEIYESIDFEAQKAQQETEENILHRQQQMIARITSNEDYEKYGENSWFAEYIEKAGQEMADVDQLYTEFEQRLAERKRDILAEEAEELKIQENRGKFESYLRGISTSGNEEYGQNLAKYSDLINSITSDTASLDAAIQKVKLDMADESGVETLMEENQATTTLLATRQQLNAAGRTDEQYTEDILDNIDARQRETEMTKEATKAVVDLMNAKKNESSIDDIVVAENGVEVVTNKNVSSDVPSVVQQEITPFEKLRSFIDTDLVKAIEHKDEEFNEELNVVTRVVDAELQQLERLRLFLYNDIPLAISEKNTSFQDELTIVRQVVDQEIAELGRLQTELTDSVNPNEIATKFNEVFSKIDFSFLSQKLVDGLSQMDQAELQKNLQTIFNTIKVSFGEENFVLPDFTNIFSGLSQILDRGEALGNLVKVLETTQERMQEIARTNIADSINRDDITSYLSDVTGFMNVLDKRGTEISNLDIGGKGRISSQIDIMIESLKEYQAVLKDSSQNQDLFAQIGPKIEYLENVKNNLAEFGTVSGKIFTQEIVSGFENLDQTIDEIKADIETLKQSMTNLKIDTDITAQASAFEQLARSLTKIKDVVLEKNKAFQQEATVVSQSVEKEISSLNNLKKSIEEIKDAVIFLNSNISTMGAENKGGLFSSIQDILNKGEELKNFAKILSATEEEIKEAEEAAIGKSDSFKTEQTIEKAADELKDNVDNIGESIDHVREKSIIDPQKIDEAVREIVGLNKDIGDVIRILDTLNEKGETVARIVQGTKMTAISQLRPEDPDDNNSPTHLTITGYKRTSVDEKYNLQAKAKVQELNELEESMKKAGINSDELKERLEKLRKELSETAPHGKFEIYNENLKQFKKEANGAIKIANELSKATQKEYKDDLDAINKLEDARSEYNKAMAANIKDPIKTNADDVARAQEAVVRANNEAMKSIADIMQKFREGKISAEQYFEAFRLMRSEDTMYGSIASQQELRNAEYQSATESIEKLIDSQSKLNLLMGKDISGNNQTIVIEQQMDRVKEAAEDANDAIIKLYDLFRNGKISGTDFYKAIDRFVQFGKSGSLESQQSLENSIRNQWNKAVEAIQNYQKHVKSVQDLQDAHASGSEMAGRVTSSMTKMNDALDVARKKVADLKEKLKGIDLPEGLNFDQLERSLGEMDGIVSGLNNWNPSDRTRGFETTERGYDTLIKGAERYYAILEKQNNRQNITANERNFLERYSEQLNNAINQLEIFDTARVKAIAEKVPGENATEEEIESINNAVKEASRQLEEYRKQREKLMDYALPEAEASAKKNYNFGRLGKINNDLTTLGSKSGTEAFYKEYAKANDLFGKLQVELNNFDWNGSSEDDFNELFELFNETERKIKDLNENAVYKPVNEGSRDQLDRRMAEWENNNRAAREAIAEIEILRERLKSVGDQKAYNEIERGFEKIRASANDAGTTGQTFAQKLRTSFSNLARYLMSFASFYQVMNVLRQGAQAVREMDTALTELRKVSDDSLSSLKAYRLETYKMADAVGTTAEQIMQSTADWVRLGRSMSDAKELASLSTKLLNVSEFTDINSATQALVSATQAYKDVAPEDIVNKLNLVGNNFAISTDELATGLQNAAAVLMTQGNDLDQTLALLTSGVRMPLRYGNIFHSKYLIALIT